jgi:hypothetical protein
MISLLIYKKRLESIRGAKGMRKIILLPLFLPLLVISFFAQTIVENPEKPLSQNYGRIKTLEEVMSIEDIGRDYYFRYPHNLKVAPDGSIFVQDIDQLIQFDFSGKFMRNFFKKGQGPGEMQQISNYCFEKSKLIVHDREPNKVLLFDLNGHFIKEFRIRQGPSFLELLYFYKDIYYFRGSDIPIIQGKPAIIDYPQIIMAFSEGGSELKEMTSFPTKSFVARVGGAQGAISINNLITVPYREKYLFLSHTPEYLVKLYDLEKNQVVRAFRRKYDRVKSEIEGSNKGRVMLNGVEFTAPPQKYLNDIFNLFIFKDRLWVMTSRVEKENGILIDVFDSDGKYVDNFDLKFPEKFDPKIFRPIEMYVYGDDIYCIKSKEDGTFAIKKYNIPADN